jgi:uncharacterized protein
VTRTGRTVRFADAPRSRWANGLGETVELWRTPGDGPFEARLSIATIGSDAPFSSLPGVDRVLLSLSPHTLTLDVDGRRTVLEQFDTVAFAGEAAVSAVGVTTPGHDLNLMVRRGSGTPALTVVPVDGDLEVHGVAVVLDGTIGGADGPLAPFDAVVGPVSLAGRGRLALAAVPVPVATAVE